MIDVSTAVPGDVIHRLTIRGQTSTCHMHIAQCPVCWRMEGEKGVCETERCKQGDSSFKKSLNSVDPEERKIPEVPFTSGDLGLRAESPQFCP